jgi:CRISPR-associated protein Cas2
MTGSMLVVFAYDTPSDRRRAKVARILDDVADRAQWSVFEGCLTDEQVEQTLKRLERVLELGTDKLRVYRVCSYCRARSRVLGPGALAKMSEYWIV